MGPFDAPAGWIPPEFREFVYEDLSDEDLRAIKESTKVFENGKLRDLTDEEIYSRMGKVVAVRDTRDGRVHKNVSETPIIRVSV